MGDNRECFESSEMLQRSIHEAFASRNTAATVATLSASNDRFSPRSRVDHLKVIAAASCTGNSGGRIFRLRLLAHLRPPRRLERRTRFFEISQPVKSGTQSDCLRPSRHWTSVCAMPRVCSRSSRSGSSVRPATTICTTRATETHKCSLGKHL